MVIKVGDKTNLSTQFAIMTILLTALIIVFVASYTIITTQKLTTQVSFQNDKFNKSLTTMVFELIREDALSKNYDNITSKTKSMVTNGTIAYVVLTDDKSENVVYATEPKLIGRNIKFAEIYLQYNLKNNYENQKTYYIKGHLGNKYAYIGYFTSTYMEKFLYNFVNKLSIILVISILFSIILALAMSKLVVRPILDLINSVQEFGKGNLKHRVEPSTYKELNSLVDAFNAMADSLANLYESLENKVAERTSELQDAYKQLQDAQSMMVHSEKMRSLGELVAGITHEINNPVNFIYGNLIHLNNYAKDLINLIDMYIPMQNQLSEADNKKIEDYKQEIDYDFIKEDLPSLIKSCQEGTERTKNIIADLKNFSRMEEMVVNSVNLEKEIDTTLNILHSKLKNRIEVHKEYEENLPVIDAFGGQLNQVFMNILDNAAFAIEDKGNIFIRIKQDKDKKNVIIEFEDDGSGMEKETADKIFDPFFTTKAPGQGTGLGMSISYKVIQRHNGSITVKSEKGKGTIFTIVLPIVRENAK